MVQGTQPRGHEALPCLFPPAPAAGTAGEAVPGPPADCHALQQRYWRVWDLLTDALDADRSKRLELKSWLLTSLAQLSPPERVRRAALAPHVLGRTACSHHSPPESPSGLQSAGDEVQRQLLLLWLEQRPAEAAGLLVRRPGVWKAFFAASPARIMFWFSHFSMDGLPAFKYGARALALYAMANRQQMWDLLVWEGKHPQAPVTVATKTHYFCELDVVASVRALVAHCPDFWESSLFADSVTAGGEALALDPAYFATALQDILAERPEGSRTCEALRRALEAWAGEGPWPAMCHRCLHVMDDTQLLQFVDAVGDAAPGAGWAPEGGGGSGAYESQRAVQRTADLGPLVLAGGAAWASVGQLALTFALAAQRRQFTQLLLEDDDADGVAARLMGALSHLYPPTPSAHDDTAQAQRELVLGLRDPVISVTSRQLIALHGWALFLALSAHGLQPAPGQPDICVLGSAAIQAGGAACCVLAAAQQLTPGRTLKKADEGGKPAGGRTYALLSSSDDESGSVSVSDDGSSTTASDAATTSDRQLTGKGRGTRSRHSKSKHKRRKGKKRGAKRGGGGSKDRKRRKSSMDHRRRRSMGYESPPTGEGSEGGAPGLSHPPPAGQLSVGLLHHLAGTQAQLRLPASLLAAAGVDVLAQEGCVLHLEASALDAAGLLASLSARQWWLACAVHARGRG